MGAKHWMETGGGCALTLLVCSDLEFGHTLLTGQEAQSTAHMYRSVHIVVCSCLSSSLRFLLNTGLAENQFVFTTYRASVGVIVQIRRDRRHIFAIFGAIALYYSLYSHHRSFLFLHSSVVWMGADPRSRGP